MSGIIVFTVTIYINRRWSYSGQIIQIKILFELITL